MALTVDLTDEQEAALNAKASAQGVSAELYALRVLEQDLKRGTRRHISETIRENMRDVPDDVMARLPSDGASQVDHYVYGLPKRDQ